MLAAFQRDMLAGIAHHHHGQQQTGGGITDPEVERDRSETIEGRQIAREERRQSDSEIAGKFVEADREAALTRAYEVYLHDDRHRPGKTLVDAEQHVCS